MHLGEVDARRLWARYRACAAREGRRRPAVVEAVRDGRLHLSAVLLLAPRLTGENHRALMAEASGKSKREVEEVVARWFPEPDAATSGDVGPGGSSSCTTSDRTRGAGRTRRAV